MKLHVISETQYMIKGNGVHTAFIDHLELMQSKNDVEIIVNNDRGFGDIFHSHTYGLYYFFKGLRYKNRRVLTVHVIPDSIKGSLPFWEKWMSFVKWYFKKVYSYADVCIAISPMVEQAIRETGASTKIVRIYNPIHTDKWLKTPEKRLLGRKILGIDENEFVVLGVGQLQARKGVEDFMDVAASMPHLKFVWAGGRPFKAMTEGVSRIDARIQMAPENLIFTGMLDLDQMPSVYASADMMLFTSYQENCPLAPIEAAASGMPVVFRDIPEYRTLYNYEYLKAASTEEFIALTEKIHTDSQFYNQAVRISKNLINQFDKEFIREKLINLYTYLNQRQIPQPLSPAWG